MIKIPEKINIANLPTRIEKLEKLSEKLGGPNIYIKRDDQTGMETSGNKVRKLEFSVKEAIDRGCDTLITCGGIQSNHCRATAAIAAKLSLKSCLVLKGSSDEEVDGNLFLDKLLGAEIHFITPEEYKNRRMEIMKEIKSSMEEKGFKPYIIPEGASNGIGGFGYYKTMEEIIDQEKELGVHFDGIVVATGSGGTYSGLLLASKILNHSGRIYGVNVCDDEEYFKSKIHEILNESINYLNIDLSFSKDEIHIMDGYVGKGYALSRKEELEFISDFAKMEGIVVDPVYTGKAMYGLTEEIKKGSFSECKNLLFIHTGGIFGIFPGKKLFENL
ncbi:D-cysteine desulfhydrase family protein [Clostridium magnum]|uniref:D-cysteine desulfhydrase n=1 Tax=Clostridium magnum DSM 2767 TaxID=1121326 RepID=A0A162TG10_9CLOT|nr:D-cysteine desulfhydrase family protein [Clostridium magnum]KZL92593.1 D-cysteine desulfhydrase [Clostridium magnum DSM 2767]SHJ05988.1 D-cysteine desulfhydrase [Clostridium magnum DSM 2767]